MGELVPQMTADQRNEERVLASSTLGRTSYRWRTPSQAHVDVVARAQRAKRWGSTERPGARAFEHENGVDASVGDAVAVPIAGWEFIQCDRWCRALQRAVRPQQTENKSPTTSTRPVETSHQTGHALTITPRATTCYFM